jgi:hypothetical protein
MRNQVAALRKRFAAHYTFVRLLAWKKCLKNVFENSAMERKL